MTALATMPSTEVATVVAERQASLPLTRDHPAQALAVLAPLRGEEQLARLTSFRPYRWVLPAWVVACVRLGRSADASRLNWLRGVAAVGRREACAARSYVMEELTDPLLPQVPFLHAQVLDDAGRVERALGHQPEAVNHLRQAQSILAALRATPLLRR